MQWYYSKNATQLGPVPEEELRAKIAAGEVLPTDLVWREGMADWRALSVMEELTGGPRAVPSGLPGQSASQPYVPPGPQGAYGAPAPVSGLAVASLACGIAALVTCTLFPGIPAVICGHMALNRMETSAIRQTGRSMAVVGLVTGYLAVAVLVMTLLMLFWAMASVPR